jgi:hypothetical protein
MNKILTIYVQQYLAAYITAVTNTNTGGFSDNEPPITPDEFEKRLTEEVYGPDFIHRAPTDDEKDVISAARVIYDHAYQNFVTLPLNGDAPPAVVAWQAEARAAAGE